MDLNHQSDWQRIFNGRQYELQELINIWQAVKTGEPQLAVVLGETGLGKTRLVQELFTHISKPDTDDPNGYWPDTLNVGRNLALDVDPRQLNAEVDLPFLWWPMRFTANDDRNQTTVISPFEQIPRELAMHSEPYKRMLERYSADKRVAKELVSVLEGVFTSLADGILLGGAIGTSMSLIEMMKERQRNKQLNQDISITDLLLERTREAVTQTISRLRLFFTIEGDAKRCPTIPVILVIDDAQWSDPVTLFSLMLVFFEAREHNWPLMVICTHWEKEWNESDDLNQQFKDLLSHNKEDLNKGEIGQVFSQLPATLSLKQVYSVFQSFDSHSGHLIPLKKLDDMMLKNVAQTALPGIKSSEIRQLVVEAGGNPRAMEEMLRRLLDKPKKYFIDADSQSSLSPAGERALAQLKNTTLYQKVFDRFDDLNDEVQILLSTGALYGVQFIRPLVLDLINHKEEVLTEDQLVPLADEAQNLYVLIQKLTERSDSFQQSLYRKVAEEHLKEDDEESYTQYKSNIAKVYARWLAPEKYQELDEVEQEQLFAMVLDYAFQSQEVQLLTPSQIGHIFDTLLAMLKGRHQYPQITLWWSKMLDQQSKPWFVEVMIALDSSVPKLHSALNESSDLRDPVNLLINTLEPLLERESPFDVEKRIAWYKVIGDIEHKYFSNKKSINKANYRYHQLWQLAKQELAEKGETPSRLVTLADSMLRIADLAQFEGDLDTAGAFHGDCLKICRRLLKDFGNNPTWMRALSVSLDRVADLANNNNGDVDTASKLYRESLQIRRRLLSDCGDTPGPLRDLAVSLVNVADLSAKQGDIVSAEELYEESLQIFRRLLAGYGASSEHLWGLSANLVRGADLANKNGDMDTAGKLYTESLQTWRKLLSDYGETPGRLQKLGVIVNKVGGFSAKRGDIDTAAKLYDESIQLSRKILSEYGGSPERFMDLVDSLHRNSDLAIIKDNIDAAKELSYESLHICQNLLVDYGDTPDFIRALTLSLNRVADLGLADIKGDWDTAEKLYEESWKLCSKLLSDLGATPGRLSDLALSLYKMANLAHSKGDIDTAQKGYEESSQVLYKLLSDYGDLPERFSDLSVSLMKLADLSAIKGKLDRAVELYEESLRVCRRLVSEYGETPESIEKLLAIIEKFAQLLNSMGDMETAEKLWKESVQIRQRMLSDDSHTVHILRALSISLEGIARCAQLRGETCIAKDLRQRSELIGQATIWSYGDTPENVWDLVVSLERLAEVAERRGWMESGEEKYEDSIRICRSLLCDYYDRTPERLGELFINLEKLADFTKSKGEVDIAEGLYQRASNIWRTLVSDYSETSERLRELSVSLTNLADLEIRKGQRDAAGKLYKEALGFFQKLLSDYSVNPDHLKDLAITLVKYADLVRSQGEMDAAENLYLEALQVNRENLSEFGTTEERLDLMFNILNHKIRILWNDDVFPKEAKTYLLEAQEILNRSIQLYGETPQREQSLMDIDARIMAIKYRFVMRPIGILMRPFIKKWRAKQ